MLLFTQNPDDKGLFDVCHHVPGRMRLRLPALLEHPSLGLERRVVSALQDIEGIDAVRANPACGSLVVHYRGVSAPARQELVSVLQPIIGVPGGRSAVARANPVRPLSRSRSARPSVKSSAGRDAADCLLCRLKLNAARWVLRDVWRCWRAQWIRHVRGRLTWTRLLDRQRQVHLKRHARSSA